MSYISWILQFPCTYWIWQSLEYIIHQWLAAILIEFCINNLLSISSIYSTMTSGRAQIGRIEFRDAFRRMDARILYIIFFFPLLHGTKMNEWKKLIDTITTISSIYKCIFLNATFVFWKIWKSLPCKFI